MPDQLFSVEGKRVFLTGGASGIGRMLSEGLAERGARIYTSSRKQASLDRLMEELKEKRGLDVLAEQADLSKMAEIDRAVKRVQEHFNGELDVLINNSGATWGAPLDEFPESGWDKVFNINVKGLFFLSQKCIPMLKRSSQGKDEPSRIVNIGSMSGIGYPTDNAWSYHPAKAAVHHLTKTMARHLCQYNVSVNAIAPGFFPSGMTSFLMPDGDDSTVASHIPMGRVGNALDIVGTVIYLVTRAGAYTTGAIVTVDGGSVLGH